MCKVIACIVVMLCGSVCLPAKEKTPVQLFQRMIEQESLQIASALSYEYSKLSDLYSSRGEYHLFLDQDQEAFEDFSNAYAYAMKCDTDEKPALIFRSMFGTFLLCIRQEDLENAKATALVLQNILHDYSCEKCQHSTVQNTSAASFCMGSVELPYYFQTAHEDWPILGPDDVSIPECLKQ